MNAPTMHLMASKVNSFSVYDYLVFALMLVASTAIGVYFAVKVSPCPPLRILPSVANQVLDQSRPAFIERYPPPISPPLIVIST